MSTIEGVERVKAKLRDVAQSQLPFATSVALNRAAEAAKKALVAEMRRAFKRPVGWTLNSLYIDPSTKQRLVVELGHIPRSSQKGTPAAKYLKPQVAGGPRPDKPGEKLLKAAGALPSGLQAYPPRGANASLKDWSTILSQLRAHRDPTQNRADGVKARFVVLPVGKSKQLGVWERQAGRLRPVLIFGKPATYKARYRFFEVAREAFAKAFVEEMPGALAYAVRTAR